MAFKEDKSIDKDASVVKFHYDGDGDGGGDGGGDGDGDGDANDDFDQGQHVQTIEKALVSFTSTMEGHIHLLIKV